MGERRGRLTPLRVVSMWRLYVEVVARAAAKIAPNARLYLVGGAAEGRLTVASDVDVLVVLPQEPSYGEAVELRAAILEEAERLGLPAYAPVELHIIGPERLREYRRRGRLEPIDLDKARETAQ